MRTLFAIWTWLGITVVVITGFVLVALLTIVTYPFDPCRRVAGRFLRLQAVLVSKLNPLWHFSVFKPLPAYRPRKTICVSNHSSNVDPYLISFLPWEMKWLAKSSLFRVPFLGWSMRLVGDIPVERGSKESAAHAMQRCAYWLERDVPVMIFPEGTRSMTDELLPFKEGAFRLALETGADILPIAIAGTADALRKHDFRPGRARGLVIVGEPISTVGLDSSQLEALQELTRTRILELRARIAPLASSRSN